MYSRSGIQFSSPPRTCRPDTKVRLRAPDLAKAARAQVVEPGSIDRTSTTEIRSFGASGVAYYHDFIIIYLMSTAARIAKTISNPSGQFANAAKEKQLCHYQHVKSTGPDSKLRPMAVSTAGS